MKRISILIVDDSKLINDTFCKSLESRGYTVTQAYNITTAKEILQNQSFDFTLLDLELPDGVGEDLLPYLQVYENLRVIIMTSSRNKKRREKIFEFGIVVDYITKERHFYDMELAVVKLIEMISSNSNLSILVVDDSKFMRTKLRIVLSKRNFKVYDTPSGKEALLIMKEKKIDALIIDLEMPIMDGNKLIGAIKRKKENLMIPIMVVSGTSDVDKISNVLKNGAYDFVRKPFVEEELLLKIDKMMEDLKQQRLISIQHEELKKKNLELDMAHKNIKASINYASLIQQAILPDENLLKNHFRDFFIFWQPKDTVGGDIWLFNELRHKDECLLLFIDCTGHGVPGAFITMIVKSIEREIIANLKKHPEFDISPALIMAKFNTTMKELLKQETNDSLANVGWDGGIIYYNARDQILKFAGAETPLFYIDENQKFQTVKNNRYSVGYKKCKSNYVYKETIIDVKEGMKFYCTTDGFLDQNGGTKEFPFGKTRFGNIIKENYAKSMISQKEIFLDTINEYETIMTKNNDRNDDMTLVVFEIGAKSNFQEDTIQEIVKYEGVMTQNVIATAMDNIEVKITHIGTMGDISTITIEYCQNMMHYSKNKEVTSREIVPHGKIKIDYINNECYHIKARNIVSIEDKEILELTLIEIQELDRAGIKKRYRELRKSGKNSHNKGGGIGMYEIAKISDKVEYEFIAINEDKFYFRMKSIVKLKEKN